MKASVSPIELPIVNRPAGISTMPAGPLAEFVFKYNRKKLECELFATVT